jgi:hypothetical protein
LPSGFVGDVSAVRKIRRIQHMRVAVDLGFVKNVHRVDATLPLKRPDTYSRREDA